MKRSLFIILAALFLAACGENPQAATEGSESAQSSEREPATSDEGPMSKGDKGKILYYRNPMGLPDTSPVPKQDWMGMDYLPVYENEDSGGDSAVAVPPETIQTIGVRIETASETVFGERVRAFGAVSENTRLQTIVSTRVDGWIRGLAVAAIGDAVKKGDLLFRLYSPELVAAGQDLLSALRSGSDSRAASATQRLKSLGVQDEAIAALKSAGASDRLVPFYAVHDGLVAALNVRDGAFVKAGDEIATLQNYEEVWVIASIPERQLPLIEEGARVAATFPNSPGAERDGVVDFVYPTVDPETRTGKARIVFNNEDGALRPGGYADLNFEIDARERLAIPSEAVLRDARGAHVVMAMGNGRFMAAPVETGLVAGGKTEILAGLSPGDAVVVSGQFLIDSESSLREALGKMAPPAGHQHSAASGASDNDGTQHDSDGRGRGML